MITVANKKQVDEERDGDEEVREVQICNKTLIAALSSPPSKSGCGGPSTCSPGWDFVASTSLVGIAIKSRSTGFHWLCTVFMVIHFIGHVKSQKLNHSSWESENPSIVYRPRYLSVE